MENYYFKKFRKVIAIVTNHRGPLFHPDRQQAIKAKIMAEIRRTPQMSETLPVRRRINLQDWGLRQVRFALIVILLLAVGSGTSYAAASAQPGDFLYSVKLLRESAELQLSISDESKAEQLTKIAERRLEENLDLQIYTVEIPKAPDDANSENLETKSSRKLTIQQAKEASEQSRQRFEQAMESLKKTQAKLEEKGHQTAAQTVRENLQRLEEKSQHINDQHWNNASENNDSGEVEGLTDEHNNIEYQRKKIEERGDVIKQPQRDHEED